MTARAETQALIDVARFWWLWLVVGVLWILAALVILQFDTTSATTVGIIAGVMFLAAGVQYLAMSALIESGWKWLWVVFGGLLVIGGMIALFYPTRTFLAIANILGFVFVLIGAVWIIEAFVARETNDLWWFSLIAGILMVGLGFWLGGQFLFTRAEVLLIFAGFWALMRGIIDIIQAFQIRKMGSLSF